jgi:hypothetical protein
MGRKLEYDLSEQSSLTKTPDKNVRGGATSLFAAMLDNTQTDGTKAYAKFYDNDGSDLVVGTTKPDIILPIPAYVAPGAATEVKGVVMMIAPDGLPFSNGLTMLASKEDGNEVTDSPAGGVIARLVTQES